MDVNLIFKIAAVGILVTIIQQVFWFDSCTVLADSLYQ